MKLIDKLLSPAVRGMRNQMGKKLQQYGLRYDDLLDPAYDSHVYEALKLLPEREQVLRNRRLLRAIDLDLKKEKLPAEIQALQDPFEPYLQPLVDKIRAQEFEKMNYN